MNKAAHAVITVFLISSTAAIHFMGDDATAGPEPEVNDSIPSFEGIEAYEKNRTVVLDSLSDRQKITLMIASYRYDEVRSDRLVGGIHLQSAPSKKAFRERVENYTEERKIDPLISVDLEGCIEPTGKFRDFKSFKKVQNTSEAFRMGRTQGEFLSDIGVDINFAPVVDLEDNIWNCRTFPGNYREVAEKACSYIEGLQSEGVMTTAKHYPGNTLTGKDPHKEVKKVSVSRTDLFPFRSSIRCGTDAVMPSHQITNGTVDISRPADASEKVRQKIRSTGNFSGLIVSDAISMGGLKNFYDSRKERYIDIFRTNDLVLNLIGGRNDTVQMIGVIEEAVQDGRLEDRFIDSSARRLLNARGWNVRTEEKLYKAWKPGKH